MNAISAAGFAEPCGFSLWPSSSYSSCENWLIVVFFFENHSTSDYLVVVDWKDLSRLFEYPNCFCTSSENQ